MIRKILLEISREDFQRLEVTLLPDERFTDEMFSKAGEQNLVFPIKPDFSSVLILMVKQSQAQGSER